MSASKPGSPPGHLPWYRSGFEGSLADFKAAISRNDEEAAFHALFAALNWAASIRDRLKQQGNPAWQDDTVQAVQFLRNAVHHDWAHGIELISGLRATPMVIRPTSGRRGGGMIMPQVIPTLSWLWPLATSLPSPKHPYGRPEYVRDLEGKPVTDALDRLAALYAAVL